MVGAADQANGVVIPPQDHCRLEACFAASTFFLADVRFVGAADSMFYEDTP
jgi:hypothetical protein